MVDESKFPPYQYVLHLAKYRPEALEVYMQLWYNKNSRNSVSVNKDDIFEFYKMSKCKFITRARMIAREGLLDMLETDSQFLFKLTDAIAEEVP